MLATNTHKNNRKSVTLMAWQDAERLLRQLVGKEVQPEDIVDLFCSRYLRVYSNGQSVVRKTVEVNVPDLPRVLREVYRDSFRRQISHITGRTPTYSDAWELPTWTWA